MVHVVFHKIIHRKYLNKKIKITQGKSLNGVLIECILYIQESEEVWSIADL